MKKRMLALGLVLAMTASTLTGCVKVVKIGEEGKYTGEEEFSATDNVAGIWESQALPDLEGKAVELADFLTEANGDLKSLVDKYGKYSMGTSGEIKGNWNRNRSKPGKESRIYDHCPGWL